MDERLRHLERLARTGDPEAYQQLREELRRAELCGACLVPLVPAWTPGATAKSQGQVAVVDREGYPLCMACGALAELEVLNLELSEAGASLQVIDRDSRSWWIATAHGFPLLVTYGRRQRTGPRRDWWSGIDRWCRHWRGLTWRWIETVTSAFSVQDWGHGETGSDYELDADCPDERRILRVALMTAQADWIAARRAELDGRA